MTKCCAPNCDHSQKSTEYRFYEFPLNSSLRSKWIANIGRPNWTPGRRSMICYAHFEKTQFKTENHQIKLIDGAIPTLFHSSRKRKGFQALKSTSLGEIESCDLGEIEAKKIYHNVSIPDDKIINTANQISSSYAPIEGVTFDSAKFMDEMVLIESTCILEDGKLVDDEVQSSIPATTCHCLIIGDDNTISTHNTCYPSLEKTIVSGEEGSAIQGSLIIVEPSSVDDTSSNIIVTPETPQSKSDSVILVQQPSQGPIGCKRSLNLTEIATPCSMTISATDDSKHLPDEDSQTKLGTVPPLKQRKLNNEDCNFLAVESPTPEPITLEVIDPVVAVLPMDKGIVELPVSLMHHKFDKHVQAAVKWQDGTFMCRLCGIASNQTVNLFSSEANRIKLLERIKSLLPIMIAQSDDLPQNVCFKCLNQLDVCSELIVTSFNTHKQLASVMGQDFNQSSQLPVYFHERKKENNSNPGCNRHILLMEICHEEGKPVEEYLSIAFEDLHMRLHPKRTGGEEPQCSMILASISNSCIVSQVEQIKTAAEALISMGVIQDKKNTRRDNVYLNIADIPLDHDSTEIASKIISDKIEVIECMPLVELPMGFELDLTDAQAMPVTDDVSPSDYYSTGIRCPQFKRVWKKNGVALKNMQSFVFWKTADGEVKLMCKVCECDLEGHSDIQGHLREHSDFSCPVCLTGFRSQHESEAHKCDKPAQSLDKELSLSYNRGRFRPWFQCALCNTRFGSKPTLKQHMLQEHAANTKCESCGYNASDVCEATLHRQKCSEFRKGKEWQCRKCLEFFPIEEELQKHQALSGHTDVTTWLCDICGESFPLGANLHKHKKSHLPPEFKHIHQCPHCPKQYINSSRLKEHMQKHEEKKYMCKVCGKLFSTKQILRQHEFTHGDPQFLCSLCSRTFFRKSHLLKHMNVHNPDNLRASRAGPQPHRDGLNRCRKCKKVFEQKELLLHYKLSHPEIQLQNYVCEICKEENTSYAELFQHQREVHKTGVKDCPFCGKTIDSSTQMKYHLMRHEGMFPYNCPMCSNGYTANSILQDHIRRKHTGEKPFECQQCSKRFPTNGALAQHSTVHSLPHQLLPCPVCNQGFKRKAHLDVHLRTHTGEKPYPCPICDRPFRQRPDCVKHVRVIHGEDPTNYDIRFHPNMCVIFPQVVSVANMELVLEGEDLMQASLGANQLLASQ